MMTEEAICPDTYLSFVHDIDLSDMSLDYELDRMIGALPGKKHIFTNGTVPHAENVLDAFGVCGIILTRSLTLWLLTTSPSRNSMRLINSCKKPISTPPVR